MIRTPVLALLLATASAGAFAQAAMPRVDAREAHQERRVDQGVASGALTAPETRRLERGEARIERMEHRALADGTVTRAERHRLHEAQGAESRRIFVQKHDAQVRR